MKHVSILIPKGGASIHHIEVTYRIFSEVNFLRQQSGKPPLFDIKLVGLIKKSTQDSGMFTINANFLITEIKKTDLIIIPAMNGNQDQACRNNKDFIPWLSQQYTNGAEVASFCVGSFFLASTGLLKNMPCSTHWRMSDKFKRQYPDVILKCEHIITDANGIYTSGGANLFLNLIIYLVEKYAGREMAILISKIYMIDLSQTSQSPFIIFDGQKEHKDEIIKKAQKFIESNYRQTITIDQLTVMLELKRRNFERRFKKATFNTVLEYIQRVKIEAAKKAFESTQKSIEEVMYDVGYHDIKAFRAIFRKVAALSPVDYRKKYNVLNR